MSGANSLDIERVLSEPHGMAAEISNNWSEWQSAREPVRNRWQETTQFVYATSTRETVNEAVGGVLPEQKGWNHSTHIPKITQIFDNLTANYMAAAMPNEDWLAFVGEDASSAAKSKRDTVESYIKTKHRLNNFRNTVQQLFNDWVLYGNTFARVFYRNDLHTDPVTEETTSGYTGPVVERISPYDIVFNPLATTFRDAPKIIRTLKTLGELSRDVEENPELGYSQDILTLVQDLRGSVTRGANVEDADKSLQLTFDGFGSVSQYLKSGFVEILEFYGDIYDVQNKKFLKNHVVTVVDRTWIIRSEPLNTWTGRPNIFHVGWRLRPDNLWAMGPLDNLVGMQYLINHLENARADGFDQMLAPTRVLVGNVDKEDIEEGRPGGEYRIYDGEGSVTNLLPDTTVLNADLQIANKANMMEEYAGSPRQEMGIKVPGEQTATQVNQLSNASGRIFQNKITFFEEQFLQPIVNAELETARRNLDAIDTIKVIDNDTGVQDFINITKDDLTANGKLVPVGARHFAKQAQLTQNLMLIQQIFSADPLLQQHFPSERYGKLIVDVLGLDKHDLMVPFGRVSEQAEMQRLLNVAQQQVELENEIDVGGEDEDLATLL